MTEISYAGRTHKKMMEVLMSPEADGPEIHYYMIRGGSKKTNITVWENGKVGSEYIKTFGHYHVGDLDETYKILQGEGILIIQERGIDANGQPIDDVLKSFRAKYVKTGDVIDLPTNAGHVMVNIGETWLVSSDNSPVNFDDDDPVGLPGHSDYEPFRKLHGAGYYVIERDGKPALLKNLNYNSVPPAQIE